MFLILIEYMVPFAEVEPHIPAHIEFVRKYYSEGRFLLTGKKIPRTGGVILANGNSKEELTELLKEDPFVKYGVAGFDLIEIELSQVSTSLLKY
ncbi:YciI family protein [Mangrovibacterium sp.]|uniref:YciI family protein n=1 Tax=Mangrovibacterium sp. TaxID=1961364 RepID=UPI00356766AE